MLEERNFMVKNANAAASLEILPASNVIDFINFDPKSTRNGMEAFSISKIRVALLDMHSGVINVGLGCIKQGLREFAQKLNIASGKFNTKIEVTIYDVRGKGQLPDHLKDEFDFYISSGGPGSPYPRDNKGQKSNDCIIEKYDWSPKLFGLIDQIQNDPTSHFFGVCYSFQLLARKYGIGQVTRRKPSQGASTGIVQLQLTEEGTKHPYFSNLPFENQNRIKTIDNRWWQVLLEEDKVGACKVLAHEVLPNKKQGSAATIIQFAKNVFGTQGHLELEGFHRIQIALKELLANKIIDEESYEKRLEFFKGMIFGAANEGLTVQEVSKSVFGNFFVESIISDFRRKTNSHELPFSLDGLV
ncbi:hypothetical protein IT568_01955 [bacterium]|nr:hypothetical protein [bacterium]